MSAPDATQHPLIIIEEEACAVAKCFGVAACDEAAALLIDRILLRLAGERIYLQRHGRREREQLHKEIRAKFNGTNLPSLSIEYGMTERHLRRILFQKPLSKK